MAKTLIKNATIISMDPGIGDIEGGDIFLDGDLIAEVGKLIEAPVAEVLDA